MPVSPRAATCIAMVFLQGKPGASISRAVTETRARANGGIHDVTRHGRGKIEASRVPNVSQETVYEKAR